MDLLKGKRGLIMGVANNKSLAWGIALALHAEGAEIAFSYQGEILLKRVNNLAASLGFNTVISCDVTDEKSIDNLFIELSKKWGTIDFLIHAIGFSDKEELRGRYIDTSRQNFLQTMDVSCFSFTSVARRASEMMNVGGSMVTLTFLGGEKVMPHYNVMGIAKAALECSVKYLAEDLGKNGIRVNSISAGPVKTLAAKGISDFNYILKWIEYNSPLRRNVTLEDVGGAALYLVSFLSNGTTGENLHVDSGYNIVGMKAPDAPDISKEQKQLY